MRLPNPLPADLTRGAFTVAGAARLGVTERRLRAGDLVSPTSGVRMEAGQPLDVLGRAAAFALALPGDVAFSHLTAARLHHLPTPRPWVDGSEPLHVMRDSGRPKVIRRGCASHRGLETRSVETVHGRRVTSPVDTWCDLAAAWSCPDLLSAADVLLRRGCRPEHLVAAAADRAGRRGAGRLREAASLARAGSESPGESRARHRFWTWGLPEPELNATVLDRHGGWLALVDFLWREQRVVGEYDGDLHRTDRRTWQRDRSRRAALEDDRWTYVELTSFDLTDRTASQRLRTRLVRLLGTAPPDEGWRSVATPT